MDKTAIKNFAVRARNKLIDQVKQKAYEIGIEKDKIVEPKVDEKGINVIYEHKKIYDREIKQRDRLINEIDQKGYDQVMEEVAYTWFNRFVALRFMEVNAYLPTGVRVLSSQEEGKVEPDIIKEALNFDLDIDAETVYHYQDDNNPEGLYRYLLVKQCNSLNEIMPFIFERIADYTEILLPDKLLSEGSVIRDMVESIEEEDWQKVEIIGWLYQFYISEKKGEVFASKSKIKKEEIPAATQLFTPDWIVKYMVENSLGRYWLETYPNEKLQEKWDYYLEEPEQEPEVKKKLEEIRDRNINPDEITVLDPACGSGHILVYAFDVLYEIYKSAGYMESDIPQLILNNNLYGLEICDRAGQLASLSVMMKAREKDPRIFKKKINLNICFIQESNRISNQVIELMFDGIENDKEKKIIENDLKYLLNVYEDAKMYGSIIDVKQNDYDLIEEKVEELRGKKVDNLFDIPNKDLVIDLLPRIIKQAIIMSQKYDIVVTNPPYMGRRNMDKDLKKYIDQSYTKSKNDLFSVFIERCINLTQEHGITAMITMQSWMFLSYFRKIRKYIINNTSISSLIHLGSKAFDEIDGEVVQACTFTLRKNYIEHYHGVYLDLTKYNSSMQKNEAVINKNNMYYKPQSNFNNLPGSPISYWINKHIEDIFDEYKLLNNYIISVGQNLTGNNKKYLRMFWEVNKNQIGKGRKWLFYAKGGGFKKWYGNIYYVINWSPDARNHYNNDNICRIIDDEYWYEKGLTWNLLSSDILGFRILKKEMTHDIAGSSFYIKDKNLYEYCLGFLNTKITTEIVKIFNPTISSQLGDIKKVPLILADEKTKNKVKDITFENIKISKLDWNSSETSWDFKKHPLLTHKKDALTIEEVFNNWSEFAEDQFYQLKENEEELNRIFIDIYGLEDELTPEVPEKDVTVRKADRGRDITSFMSYAVGCMLGRYSLDEEGLVYAGGEFDKSRYETFEVDEDGIIPVLDDEYFDDDIVAKFVEFVRVTFGEEHLEGNLEYIADALIESGTSGQKTPRETIRRYFLFDFIKDHVSTYNKRPIYWLFQSDGRGKAFNALIYMHRYDKNTVARVRTDYLHELQKKIEAEKVRLQGIIDSDLSTREKNKAKKKLKKLENNTKELREYDEKLNHLANQQIEIDLDDGVDENYKKFDEVLKNI